MNGAGQAHRIPHVQFVKGDVVVPQQNQMGVLLHFALDPSTQRLEPTHFVDKFVAVGCLTIGKIAANHAQLPARTIGVGGGNHARQLVFKARNVFHHRSAGLHRDQGHPVVGFLSKPLGLVTRIGERRQRKLVVTQFEFLQGQDVHAPFGFLRGQPVQHLRQAHGQRVDIPGGDFHGVLQCAMQLSRPRPCPCVVCTG